MMKHYAYYDSKIGKLRIAVDGDAVKQIVLMDVKKPLDSAYVEQEDTVIHEIIKQLDEYFSGKRVSFQMNVQPEGTPFQKKVWAELANIPYGETRSYKDIAEAIGCPKGSRAIGACNNKNPIIIVCPCHRVIGANGKLVGYAGGIHRKEQLLELEGIAY